MTVSPQLRVLSALCAMILTGCTAPASPTPSPATPTAPTASATTTPTPTTTWSPNQAAAIKAVDDSNDASESISSNPRSFTEVEMTKLLKPSVGGGALDAVIAGFMKLREARYRVEGRANIVWTVASGVTDDGRGLEVHITICRDQRTRIVVDQDGVPVPGEDFNYPEYNLRQYSVRKPPGEKSFRVFGVQTVNGSCP